MDSLNRIHIKSPDLGWNLYCCIVKVRVNRWITNEVSKQLVNCATL
jgi:hypothetical protein